MKIDFNTKDYDKLKLSQLKRIADYWQRHYLIKKATKNGLGEILCPIKDKFYPQKKVQASHFIDRSKMCTRYHEDNVWLISEISNVWDAKEQVEGYKSKHHMDFKNMLKSKIGEKRIENLFELSKEYCIFAREDYIKVIKKFRNE